MTHIGEGFTRATLARHHSLKEQFDAAIARVKALGAVPKMTAAEQRALLIAKQQAERLYRESEKSHATYGRHFDRKKRCIAAFSEEGEWRKAGYRLVRAEVSQLHHFIAASQSGEMILDDFPDFHDDEMFVDVDQLTQREAAAAGAIVGRAHIFVAQRVDWGAALRGAENLESPDFRLPFDLCAFEFNVSGKHVIAFATHTADDDQQSDVVFALAIRLDAGWIYERHVYRHHVLGERKVGIWQLDGRRDRRWQLAQYIGEQIKAACVALEAELAEVKPIRQPEKLVAARKREGKPPPRDYSVIDLSLRQRRYALEPTDATHRRVRLHFRRGHWRRIDKAVTWVRWCLVGDPNLGFIDQEYRL